MPHTIAEQIIELAWIVAGLLTVPAVMIGLDFWAGIRKAKARGDKIRSDKMQRTLQKVSRYYNAVLAMLVLDAVQITGCVFLHIYNNWTLYTFPLFTIIGIAFVAAIEIKSIMEPADAKEARDMKEVSALAKAIAEHRQDPKEIAEAIAEYLNTQKNENTNR